MLYEILDVKQEAGEPFCRWFADKYFDLYVWYHEDKSIHSFQLCYNKMTSERCLAWESETGNYRHLRVDSGESTPRANMTPILLADGLFKKDEIAALFKQHGVRLEKDLAAFIYQKLVDF